VEEIMRAAVWHGRRDVRIENVPEPPPPPPGQVQVEVAWCGICGTDLHEYIGGPLYIPERAPHPLTGVQAPVIIGHEMSGRVIATGDGVENLAAGDRVAACPIIGCGKCRWCRSGSMAQCETVAFLGTSWTGGALSQRLNLNAYQCYVLPDSITDEIGALVEPFSSTYRALVKGNVGPEDNVAILGAGPIGLMNLMAARILGAKRAVVLEVAERRIKTALECGATAVINPSVEDPHSRALELTDGDGFDVVVECAGLESTGLLAGRLARTRGRVIVMGVFEKPSPLDFTDLVFREKTIVGSMSGYGLYNESIAVMNDSRFHGEKLITNRIPLESLIEDGYRSLLEQKDRQVKILVSPTV
jgi:(R,R)-butanediol dehydrogenase/meso-butanediol dehydrogenase/diacetyl reductase